MNILFLDLSSDNAVCALFCNSHLAGTTVVDSRSLQTPHVVINCLLQSAGLVQRDLTAIATAVGPGSYTGIRNTAAVAKAIAYSHPPLSLLPISSLVKLSPDDVTLSRIDERKETWNVVLLEDAKIGGLYVQDVSIIRTGSKTLQASYQDPKAMSVGQFAREYQRPDLIVSSHSISWLEEKMEADLLGWLRPIYLESTSFNYQAIWDYSERALKESRVCSWQEIPLAYMRKTQAEVEYAVRNGRAQYPQLC